MIKVIGVLIMIVILFVVYQTQINGVIEERVSPLTGSINGGTTENMADARQSIAEKLSNTAQFFIDKFNDSSEFPQEAGK